MSVFGAARFLLLPLLCNAVPMTITETSDDSPGLDNQDGHDYFLFPMGDWMKVTFGQAMDGKWDDWTAKQWRDGSNIWSGTVRVFANGPDKGYGREDPPSPRWKVGDQLDVETVFSVLLMVDGNCLSAPTSAQHEKPVFEACDTTDYHSHQVWEYDTVKQHLTAGLSVNLDTQYCLDASQRNVDDGRVHMWTCSDHWNQKWEYANGGIKSVRGKCLEKKVVDDMNVVMYSCDEKPAQQWTVKAIAPTRRLQYV